MNTPNKCPACRSPLPAMATKCEACGTEIQAEAANKSVLTLAERFKLIEGELTGAGLSGSKLEAELKSRRGREIRDFPVPNGRSDLISLLHYIAPRLDGANADPNIEDWRAKFREVTSLAKNSFKGDAKARAEVEEIEKSVQVSMTGELKNRAKRSPLIAIVVVVVIVLGLGGLASVQLQKRKLGQCEEKFEQDATAEKARLDAVVVKATNELKAGSFADAQATTSGIRWGLIPDCKQDVASSMASQWDQKRSELAELISTEENKILAQRKAAEEKLAAEEKAAADKAAMEEKAAADKAAAAAAAAASKAATASRKAATDKEY